MLSDRISHVKSPKKHIVKHARYSDAQKLEAVKCWLITGNAMQTASSLGIPLVTFNSWRYSQWWSDLVKELKAENNIKLSNRLKTIADKAMILVEDRLENGDWIYDQKSGEMRRKPVIAKDAHKIAADLIQIQMKVEQPVEENNDKIMDRLDAIKNAMIEITKAKKPVQVTDVVFVEK